MRKLIFIILVLISSQTHALYFKYAGGPEIDKLETALSISKEAFVEEVDRQAANCVRQGGYKADICLQRLINYIESIPTVELIEIEE